MSSQNSTDVTTVATFEYIGFHFLTDAENVDEIVKQMPDQVTHLNLSNISLSFDEFSEKIAPKL